MNTDDVGEQIAELRKAVDNTLSRLGGDERAMLLRLALLSQIKTVELHFELMSLEKSAPLFLSLQDFDEIMRPYLQLNKLIRRLVTRTSKSLYETDPINGFYELLSHHFREDGER